MSGERLDKLKIDASWTLFLDRDGVLNRRIIDHYVCHWGQWKWLPGVRSTLVDLSARFGRMVVVTNQRGIARALMSEADLADIHARMRHDLEAAGARLDGIYYCPHDRDTGCDCRKPGPGMVRQAQAQFPEIDLNKAIMVGDSVSDMEMALPLGIHTVFIGELPAELRGRVDADFPSLAAFAQALRKR